MLISVPLILILLMLSGCNLTNAKIDSLSDREMMPDTVTAAPTGDTDDEMTKNIPTDKIHLIDEDGNTLDTRILTPSGYERIPSSAKELTGFIRNLELKEAGSKVLLYDGSPSSFQDGHDAVFCLDVGDRNLQQCADSVMRIYAEYYRSVDEYNKIAFHLTNGFLLNYTKWREGYRIVVDTNKVTWKKSESYDDSYETFRNYLTTVFIYAGTLSLAQECSPIELGEILPGDMFLKGGSPGHCVLIVDIAEDQNGNRCYLLAQGYMPAQDFHIIKNPLHTEDPWYYEDEITFPLKTPQWTFEEGSLMRWSHFELKEAKKEP